METYGVPDISDEVFETISYFQPYDIDRPFMKVGPPRDGGYVLAEQPDQADLISFGISNDVRFETIMADRGSRCFMYDHTIDGLPGQHPNFFWKKLGVSGANDETPELLSVASHLERIDHAERLILKIDVEGAEWDVFSTIDDADLRKFDQITGEFHWLLNLADPAFRGKVKAAMERLTRHFTLFHVHANNCRPLGFVGGFAAADVLELSFIRNDLTSRTRCTRLFPDTIDKANNLNIGDHALLFYPFVPTEEVGRMVDRIRGDRFVY